MSPIVLPPGCSLRTGAAAAALSPSPLPAWRGARPPPLSDGPARVRRPLAVLPPLQLAPLERPEPPRAAAGRSGRRASAPAAPRDPANGGSTPAATGADAAGADAAALAPLAPDAGGSPGSQEDDASDSDGGGSRSGRKRPAPRLLSRPVGCGCVQCGATQTPVWRTGPAGPKTLCNRCGVRYSKMSRRNK